MESVEVKDESKKVVYRNIYFFLVTLTLGFTTAHH